VTALSTTPDSAAPLNGSGIWPASDLRSVADRRDGRIEAIRRKLISLFTALGLKLLPIFDSDCTDHMRPAATTKHLGYYTSDMRRLAADDIRRVYGETDADTGFVFVNLEKSYGLVADIASEAAREAAFAFEVLATALHEAVHYAENPPTNCTGNSSDFDKLWHAAVTNNALKPLPTVRPWGQHGVSFIRGCVHITHRAAMLGERIAFVGIFNNFKYGLPSSPAEYAHALGDEPERLADLPLIDVLKTEPPKALTDVFARDVRDMELVLSGHPDAEKGVTR